MRIWAFPAMYPFDYPGLQFSGIFAHRQYKGLIQNGADLKVVFPVPWSPVFPFSLLHPEWKKYQQISYPLERVYDGIKVYQPRISNIKPNRFERKSYSERYVESIVGFFRKNNIKLNPYDDIFYSQWLPDSALVQLAAHRLGVKSAILSIGDDVVLWPHTNNINFNLFKKTLIEADFRFFCADYLGKLANNIVGINLDYDVIVMGVDYNFFKPIPLSEKNALKKVYNVATDKIIILNIGTAVVRKGWLDLLTQWQR